MYYEMPDGTVKQINPFTGTEVWTVPGRANRPINTAIPKTARKIEKKEPEDYCNFCPTRYLNTPPEKARVVKDENGQFVQIDTVSPDELNKSAAEFRRVPNLFEIMTIDYWRKNHGYKLSPDNKKWKEAYLNSEKGWAHVRNVLNLKLKLSGKSQEEIEGMTEEEILNQADAFFGGGHELIIARRHYTDNAEYDSQLCSSGELTQEEHYQYLKFTIDAGRDIYENNRYARYVTVFQNWLAPAGASFDHLHKQLVAMDEWGASMERELDLVRNNPNIYNEKIINFAMYSNFTFAENEHAIALAELGHRYPTIGIYSKSPHCRPWEHTEEELRSFSILLHACHAAMGSQIACNEEWYYSPIDSIIRMPWHVLIKWRTNNPAGFEGGTKIYINPISPIALRDK
ncbi:MAG: DUF4921 family protein, partial [Armatimonadetes bacterium]|nr:DUF4921 family protein [Armatimonadota bacterium]